ncbi:MAG TPA: hypothetical protein VFQ80_06155 [Thermomicrobiales bacterium]|jgi:hypothetical protein|nr:hypothetical protein [Thermomicrobiales bacterium]
MSRFAAAGPRPIYAAVARVVNFTGPHTPLTHVPPSQAAPSYRGLHRWLRQR